MSITNDNAGASTNTTGKRAPRYIGPTWGVRVPERFIADESLSPLMVANAALALVARCGMATTEHGSAVARAATRGDREGQIATAKALSSLAADELALAGRADIGSAGGIGSAAHSHQIASEAGSLAGWMLRAVVFADAIHAGYEAGNASDAAVFVAACENAGVRFRAA